ncbi:MAG: hypothetical protein ABII74_08880 [Elusimicrobiota bacterium]
MNKIICLFLLFNFTFANLSPDYLFAREKRNAYLRPPGETQLDGSLDLIEDKFWMTAYEKLRSDHKKVKNVGRKNLLIFLKKVKDEKILYITKAAFSGVISDQMFIRKMLNAGILQRVGQGSSNLGQLEKLVLNEELERKLIKLNVFTELERIYFNPELAKKDKVKELWAGRKKETSSRKLEIVCALLEEDKMQKETVDILLDLLAKGEEQIAINKKSDRLIEMGILRADKYPNNHHWDPDFLAALDGDFLARLKKPQGLNSVTVSVQPPSEKLIKKDKQKSTSILPEEAGKSPGVLRNISFEIGKSRTTEIKHLDKLVSLGILIKKSGYPNYSYTLTPKFLTCLDENEDAKSLMAVLLRSKSTAINFVILAKMVDLEIQSFNQTMFNELIIKGQKPLIEMGIAVKDNKHFNLSPALVEVFKKMGIKFIADDNVQIISDAVEAKMKAKKMRYGQVHSPEIIWQLLEEIVEELTIGQNPELLKLTRFIVSAYTGYVLKEKVAQTTPEPPATKDIGTEMFAELPASVAEVTKRSTSLFKLIVSFFLSQFILANTNSAGLQKMSSLSINPQSFKEVSTSL